MATLNGFSGILAVLLIAVNSQELVKEQCTQKSDLAFVIDSSGSISRRNFQKEKEFVKEVASTFKMGPDQSQIAVISYSDDAQIDIKFGEYSNVNDFNAAVDSVTHQRQRTRIDLALDLAASGLFTPEGGARPNVAKVMVVLTDGKQTNMTGSKALDVAVRPLQDINVTIFAVGVGNAIDINELLLLVGKNVENLFRAQNFNELAKDSLRLAAQTCKRIRPPTVHGDWSAWAEWGDCSQSCGGGVQGRRRSCTNPPPSNGGRDCAGKSTEVQSCNNQGCPVNGSWSDWSDWGSCSLTCGEGGIKKRSRTCTNPPPANGGLDCVGPREETSECNIRACPVDGRWSEWQKWSVCTRSCGRGIQTRARACDSPRPAHGGKQCSGASGETRFCNTNDCPVDGNWSGWKPWGPCTKSCGGGSQTSSRTCTNPPPTNGGEECRGENERSRDCNTQPCPVDGEWSAWVEWSICTTSCGVGTQRRFRSCSNPRPTYGGRECIGSRIETRNCNSGSCPVDGLWSNWEEWGTCTKSCGGGVQKRIRSCTNPPPANGGRDCIGQREQTQTCNQNACPVDGEWSRWTEWTACSRTCGIGEKKRSRTCTNPRPANGGKDCPGAADETRECSNRICPVDGQWSDWKDWSPCSTTCGAGTQERARTCTEPRPAFGGKDCIGVSRESKSCQGIPCPVDGGWTDWEDWTPCSQTCGSGFQERVRSCTQPRPAFGGKDCVDVSRETKSCQVRACPVDGKWTPWTEWTSCSKTCGAGTQTRERKCENPRPEHGGKTCDGPKEQARVCNARNCPVDGQWSEWKQWTECTRTCGGGIQTRARTCTRPSPAHGGKDCAGRGDETRPCATDSCPIDGNWSKWTEWKECSRTCGGGFHSRSRTCTNPPPRHGGKDCSGKPDETRPCNTQSCPVHGQWSSWTEWTTCSKSCGAGEQKRSRTCTDPPPRHGGNPCPGQAQQTQGCNAQSCSGCSEIADIAFLVDASESLTEKDFVNEKEIIKKIAATFDVGKAKSHLGLISFSTDAHIRVKFGDHLDLRSFQDAVDKIPFAAGGTRFDKAFGEAANGLFSANGGVRPDLPKVMIIFTDGKQSADYDAVPIERSVLPLRHLGVRIFALAIGSQVDMNELRQMVNDPKDVRAFKDFDDLLDDVKKVGNETCEIIKRPEVLCVEKADVAFLMDASESMTEDDFEKQKSFVTKVAESFHMAPKTTQFALVTYSSSAKLHIRFRDHLNQDTFNKVVRQLPFAAGGTRFDKALKLAAEDVFTTESGARAGVPRVMIILTDGRQSQDYDVIPLQQAVLPLHQMSVQIHAVAIGSQVNRVELRKLVRNEQDIFSIKDFDTLVNKSRQLASKTCNIITRPPPAVKCSEDADLAFVVDTSGSISDENFQKQKDFIKVLASSFDPILAEHQLGLISYSTDTQMEVSFQDKADRKEFEQAVDRIPHTKGRTRLDKALELASSRLFTASEGIRSEKRRIMIILTDGRQSQDPDTVPLKDAVLPLRQLGVRTYTVAIGDEVDLKELYQVTERNEDVFPVSDFDDLANMANDIALNTCRVKAPSQGECKEFINLAFVMDMSSSITSKNYPKEKDFVKNVADTFSISPTKTDAGVVTYNRDAKLWIRFGQFSNNDDFKKAVDQIPYWGGSTRIDNGLKMASVELFETIKGERAKLPNVLILLTDGKQNSDPRATPLEEAVLPLFQLGVKVFAVGIGDQISRDELRLIVEKDQDIFTVDDFDDLLAKSHQIARAACDEVKATELSLQGLAGTYQSCFKNVDIGFAIDSSDSATTQEYQQQKQLVQRLSSYYDVSKQDTRVGVVLYSDKAFTTVGMNSYRNSSIIRRAVSALPHLGGGNRKDKALVAARRMFKARRPSGSVQATQVLVLITEGAQSGVAADMLPLEHAVHPLRKHGVRVIVVGVGRRVLYQELRSIAQDPNDIYLTTSLDDMEKATQELMKIICKF